MSSDEGVVYISQSGTFWSAPEIDADTLRAALEDEFLREQLDKASSKIFNGMYRITVRDQDGEEDEDLTKHVMGMFERPKVALWSRMKQSWEDIWGPGAFICRPVWKRDGAEVVLDQLMRFDPFSFNTAPSEHMGDVYCDILQGIVLNDSGETEFWQTQDSSGQPVKLKPGVVLLKDPTSTKLGGTSKAVYLVPVVKMRTFCADSQMQKVNRIAAPIFFIKVTNPSEEDKKYAQYILKNWGKDVAFQVRENMEIVTLDLKDSDTALTTIQWLESRLEAPFRGASNLDKEGGSIGGNAAAQKDESDDWVAGQRTMIEDLWEGLLQEYLDRNGYDGYTIEVKIAEQKQNPGYVEARQAEIGATTGCMGINEMREKLGLGPLSDEEIDKMLEERAKLTAAMGAAGAAAGPDGGDAFEGAPLEEIRDKAEALGMIRSINPVDPDEFLSHEEQLAFLGIKRQHGKSG